MKNRQGNRAWHNYQECYRIANETYTQASTASIKLLRLDLGASHRIECLLKVFQNSHNAQTALEECKAMDHSDVMARLRLAIKEAPPPMLPPLPSSLPGQSGFQEDSFRSKVRPSSVICVRFNAEISRRHLSCLLPDQWVNDEAAEEEVATLQHELKKNKVDGREFRILEREHGRLQNEVADLRAARGKLEAELEVQKRRSVEQMEAEGEVEALQARAQKAEISTIRLEATEHELRERIADLQDQLRTS
eukprot:g22448.t1